MKDTNLIWEEIEYIIYVRKSTDENSWKQQQSIPDQIEACLRFAENWNNWKWYKIRTKPKTFPFETKEEIRKEDNLPNPLNRKIYQDTRHLYIVKEEHSAKTPRGRPKRERVIKLVREWKIKWIISYSPDRQARNMVDGWEIIHLAHEEKVDLKYANFSFENNAWWRMMLWVRFVFSKQYSDKLSEDVARWYKSKVSKWQCFDKVFYGYKLNNKEQKHIVKDERHFDLMKNAFRKKINNPEKRTDEKLAKRLNENWFRKTNRAWKETKVTAKKLWEQWKSHLYYGLYIHWNSEYDLRENQRDTFEPMIDEYDHKIIIQRSIKESFRYTQEVKAENKQIFPIDKGFVQWSDWAKFSPEIPNKGRYKPKLLELQKTNPKATLADIIQPHQIKYTIKQKTSKLKWLSITLEEILDAVKNMLDSVEIDQVWYDAYLKEMKARIQEEDVERYWKLRIHKKDLSILTEERDDFYRRWVWQWDKDEQKEFKKHLKEYNAQLDHIQDMILELESNKRHKIEEFEIFINMIQNLHKYFDKWDYVRKGKLIRVIYSNITIDKQKRLTLAVKPWLDVLFSWLFTDGRSRGREIKPFTWEY